MEILAQLIINVLIAGALYALMAMGFSLMYGVTKFLNFAHGVIAVVGGYSVFIFSRVLALDLFLGILLGIVVAALAGFGLDKLIYAPLRKRKASGMALLVASLGIFIALESIITILFTSRFYTIATNINEPIFIALGGVITLTQTIIIISALLVFVILILVLKKTSFGKAVRAISDDIEVSKIIGINTNRIIGYVFLIGSAIAGLAGIFAGLDTGLEPTMGLNLLLGGLIAAIV